MTPQPLLASWQNFFIIIGAASATLTGLMFVVTTLMAGLESQVSTLNAGTSAFTTPTIVHFCAVLLMAGILSAPWPAFLEISLVLGLSGLAGVVYLIVVMRRMRFMPDYATPLKDWIWYMALPLLAYLVFIAAAIALPANPSLVLYFISAGMAGLLFISIHNAWDLVTYLAVERSHPADKGQE